MPRLGKRTAKPPSASTTGITSNYPERTDQEIVDQTNELAWLLYQSMGYGAPQGYRFDKAKHSRERGCWDMACIAQELLTRTDPDDALSNLEE